MITDPGMDYFFWRFMRFDVQEVFPVKKFGNKELFKRRVTNSKK